MLYYVTLGIWLIMVFGLAVLFAAEAMDDYKNDRVFHFGFHVTGFYLYMVIGLYVMFLEI